MDRHGQMTRERRTQARLHLLNQGHAGLGRVEARSEDPTPPPHTHTHSQWEVLGSFRQAVDREDDVTQRWD